MKKISITIGLVLGLIFGSIPNFAHASENPKVESFKFTPNEIDLTSNNLTVNFELVVSHPFGIENFSTLAKLTDANGGVQSTYLTRTDNPVNSTLEKVTFKGSIVLSRGMNSGVYSVSAEPVKNNSKAGYQYSTGTIYPAEIRTLTGAESDLLVRTAGDLKYNYKTFEGPTFDTTKGNVFRDTAKFNSSIVPNWRVGESLDLKKYFELWVPSLSIKAISNTPATCTVSNQFINFIGEGQCILKVFTAKTNDYLEYSIDVSETIKEARKKSIFTIEKIADQTSKDLPKTIKVNDVYTMAEGYVFPVSQTPTVCIANSYFIKLLSGGTCTLTYQTLDTKDYLASEIYVQTFEITRDAQTITFEVPATAKVGDKGLALTATASSAGAISYSSKPDSVCSVSGVTLNFKGKGTCKVTATQAGTATIAPVSVTKSVSVLQASAVKKQITCVKGSNKIKIFSTKCPRGYKKR